MDIVKVNREKLLETVRDNRHNHAEEHRGAQAAYLKARFEETKEWALKLKNGEAPPRCSGIQEPQSHLEEYDEVIAQLEWSTEEELEISQYDFQRFVLDKWEWRRAFELQLASSAEYLKGR